MGGYGTLPQGGTPRPGARSSTMYIVASVLAGVALASVALVAASRGTAASSVSPPRPAASGLRGRARRSVPRGGAAALARERAVLCGDRTVTRRVPRAASPVVEQELLQRQAAPQQMQKVQYMPVRYVEAPAKGRKAQAVRYVEVPQRGTKLAAAPRGRHQGKEQRVEYVMMPQQARRAAPRRPVRRQQLRVGGAGVKQGAMLDGEDEDEDEDADGGDDEDAEEEAPAAVTPPTPEEIAKALQRIQERQIQEQTFHDTLVDAQTGQPLHVPGVAGSAHNGVSGIGMGRVHTCACTHATCVASDVCGESVGDSIRSFRHTWAC